MIRPGPRTASWSADGAGGPQAARRHPAAVTEDTVNGLIVAVSRRLGRRPHAVCYVGYGAAPGVPGVHGAAGWVRVLARVRLTRPQPAYLAPTSPVRGWRAFTSLHVAGAAVTIDVGGASHSVTADRSGVVDVVLPAPLAPGEHAITVTPAGGPGTPGRVLVFADVADGLVSDIDDTVMVTWLPRPFIAAWNTFVLHETARREVPGMSEFYATFTAAHPGAPVIYLSTGPWNAAPFLGRFLQRHRFPDGPLLLTDWGPTNSGWFRSGQEHKRSSLARLAAELPGVRWLLVGDDGQHDPEIYDEFARAEPGKVTAVALRRLSATEQVLSRLGPLAGTLEPISAPSVTAADGYGLAGRLTKLGVL